VSNVQGFVADDGTTTIIEINPRLSGGLALTQRAGADLLGAYVARAVGRSWDGLCLDPAPGVVMLRYQACDDTVCYRPTTGRFAFDIVR
jgi:carbamoyl-phosphate synthase large subunit